jgi:hypothetical protein
LRVEMPCLPNPKDGGGVFWFKKQVYPLAQFSANGHFGGVATNRMFCKRVSFCCVLRDRGRGSRGVLRGSAQSCCRPSSSSNSDPESGGGTPTLPRPGVGRCWISMSISPCSLHNPATVTNGSRSRLMQLRGNNNRATSQPGANPKNWYEGFSSARRRRPSCPGPTRQASRSSARHAGPRATMSTSPPRHWESEAAGVPILPQQPAINPNPAVPVPLGSRCPLAATACTKSGCHPEGDLRGSWKLVPANPV